MLGLEVAFLLYVEATTMSEHARALVKANNLQNVVEVIEGLMEDVTLPEKAWDSRKERPGSITLAQCFPRFNRCHNGDVSTTRRVFPFEATREGGRGLGVNSGDALRGIPTMTTEGIVEHDSSMLGAILQIRELRQSALVERELDQTTFTIGRKLEEKLEEAHGGDFRCELLLEPAMQWCGTCALQVFQLRHFMMCKYGGMNHVLS
ncbi:hypothetical protein V8G54_021909 [Vigna mungo]|uniref:Uncharacterized protein n=1 Tax=Vigna mungo TaxID=3915 RepID=A0AAQ3NH03_VIGMU